MPGGPPGARNDGPCRPGRAARCPGTGSVAVRERPRAAPAPSWRPPARWGRHSRAAAPRTGLRAAVDEPAAGGLAGGVPGRDAAGGRLAGGVPGRDAAGGRLAGGVLGGGELPADGVAGGLPPGGLPGWPAGDPPLPGLPVLPPLPGGAGDGAGAGAVWAPVTVGPGTGTVRVTAGPGTRTVRVTAGPGTLIVRVAVASGTGCPATYGCGALGRAGVCVTVSGTYRTATGAWFCPHQLPAYTAPAPADSASRQAAATDARAFHGSRACRPRLMCVLSLYSCPRLLVPASPVCPMPVHANVLTPGQMCRAGCSRMTGGAQRRIQGDRRHRAE